MTLEEAQGDGVAVWSDNLQAVNIFIAASTQWRTGASGATGLDYTALESVMRMSCVKRGDMADLLEDIRIMEDVALETMRKSQKQA